MPLCGPCLLLGFCQRLKSRKVTEREIDSRPFLLDLKRHARGLSVTFDSWGTYLIDLYRDYPGLIVDTAGNEVDLNTETLALPSMKDWAKAFIGRDPWPLTVSHVRLEARERVIVMSSLLRAVEPVKASLWGKVVANDRVPGPPPANYDQRVYCPYGRILRN